MNTDFLKVFLKRPLTAGPMMLFGGLIVYALADGHVHDVSEGELILYALSAGLSVAGMVKDSFDKWVQGKYRSGVMQAYGNAATTIISSQPTPTAVMDDEDDEYGGERE